MFLWIPPGHFTWTYGCIHYTYYISIWDIPHHWSLCKGYNQWRWEWNLNIMHYNDFTILILGILAHPVKQIILQNTPDSKVHAANMGPTWVLSAPDGPHVGLVNQGSWGKHGAHLGPVGPRWAPCWPREPYYQGLDWSVIYVCYIYISA